MKTIKEYLINEVAADLAKHLRYFINDKSDEANDKRYHSTNSEEKAKQKGKMEAYEEILNEINNYFDNL